MRQLTKVTLLRSGNRLVVDPTTDEIRDLLIPKLTLVEKKFYHGRALAKRREEGQLDFDTIEWECFGRDHRNRIGTSLGFWKRIKSRLEKTGDYRVVMRDMTPHPHPEVFIPQWDRLTQFGIELRHRQREFFEELLSHRNGRFDCPTGYGKSFQIAVLALLLPKARIDVVSKRVAVLRDRIYPELCQYLPNVGIVGGGKHTIGCRVMCFTSGSMHHAEGDADILVGDECHELVSDVTAARFARWDTSRNYGLSASHGLRLDNKDLRAEAIFGPIVFSMHYDEAREHGMVVPLVVRWTSVTSDTDPCQEAEDDVDKKRLGIWTNDDRNDLIAKDAKRYGPKVQVLITCDTIEHAVNLKKRLPDYTLVYREEGMSRRDRRNYIRNRMLKPDEPYMTLERKMKLTRMFEKGKLKKVICTTVWNAGVNFTRLRVLIRADGGGSPVNDIQIPGRASRTFKNKTVGIIHDYMDQFNSGFQRKAANREKSYARQKWKQIQPKKAVKGSLRQRLFWEFEDD